MQPRAAPGRGGESDAALYDRYAPAIFAYARLHLTSREDAEDLTLEVFLAALEHNNLAGLPENEKLAWLRRVARNKVIDSYRRSARRPVVELDEVAEMLYDDEERAPEQVTLRNERYGRLHVQLKSLSVLQQQLLRLRYGDGLRFAEIAVLLDKREVALRKMLSRTLASLRNAYNQQGEDAL